MAMQWNPTILSKFIAPDIAEFTTSEIPQLETLFPQASHWVTNHFLNNALRTSFKDGWRQVVLGYIRRTHNAFTAYHEARLLTLSYLDGNQPLNPRVSQYFNAVSSWENFALQVSMALDLFKYLNQGTGSFEKNDGSKEQRLYEIANLVKHTVSAVKSGQCSNTDTVPLWLGNEGLRSFTHLVSYTEASEVLIDLSVLAEDYQDPYSLHEKWSTTGGLVETSSTYPEAQP